MSRFNNATMPTLEEAFPAAFRADPSGAGVRSRVNPSKPVLKPLVSTIIFGTAQPKLSLVRPPHPSDRRIYRAPLRVMNANEMDYYLLAVEAHVNRPSVRRIIGEVAGAFDVPVDLMLGARRTLNVTWPRQVAMWLVARSRLDLSYPQIGRLFGGRDHTTILHSVRKLDGLYAAGELDIPLCLQPYLGKARQGHPNHPSRIAKRSLPAESSK